MVELLVQQGGAGSIVQIELAEAALSKRLSQTLRVYEYTTKVGGVVVSIGLANLDHMREIATNP